MGYCSSSPTQRLEEGIPPPPPPPARIHPRFGPTPLQAAELRLSLAKLGHGRLGDAALEWLGVRADGDVLQAVGVRVSGRWPVAELEALEVALEAAVDPRHAIVSSISQSISKFPYCASLVPLSLFTCDRIGVPYL
jgi:hypothetical protein